MAGSSPRCVAVLGAGAWGTALTLRLASQGHRVHLWVRGPQRAEDIAQRRVNEAYLPGHRLPESVLVSSDLDEVLGAAVEGQSYVLVATPMAGLRDMLQRVASSAQRTQAAHGGAHGQGPRVAWLCKGFEDPSGLLGHEVAAETLAGWPVTVISGPSFADEVARRQPTALVAASVDAEAARDWALLLHDGWLRVYTSNDAIGAEVGGAVKNVLAIAAGVCDGLPPAGLGTNARAALVTRGLAEMTRLGVRLGARADTFMGLAGLGDLVLTATGPLSRNRRVGLRLAAGAGLDDILSELGHVAEGVRTAPMVLNRARALGVDMPITAAVVDLLAGRRLPVDAVSQLLAREPGEEGL